MTDKTALTNDERQRFARSLPWFVNGTLEAEEARWMEAAAFRDPWASGLLRDDRNLTRAVARRAEVPISDLGWSELEQRVRADQYTYGSDPRAATSRGARPPGGFFDGWVQRLTAWLGTPAIATAMACLLLVQSLGLAVLMTGGRDAESEQTRSIGGSTSTDVVRVVFAPAAPESEIRRLLLSTEAVVIDGPSSLGEYWVSSRQRAAADLVAALRQSSIVESAAPDPWYGQGRPKPTTK